MHNDFVGFTPGGGAGDEISECLGFGFFEFCFVLFLSFSF